MEYTSQKEPLIIAEYGRNVHKLINHCKTIVDKEERQKFAEAIIQLMSLIVPQQHNRNDYQDKLWKHFFRMADYTIDVETPSGEIPQPRVNLIEPQKVDYPSRNSSFRHYGSQIKDLIAKAIEMEDGAKKDEFVTIIGSFMKMAYKNWNREHYVSDQIIIEDLASLSKGKLVLLDDASLDVYMAGMDSSNNPKNKSGNSIYNNHQNPKPVTKKNNKNRKRFKKY